MPTSYVSSKTVGFHQADTAVTTVAQRIGCSEVPANMPASKIATQVCADQRREAPPAEFLNAGHDTVKIFPADAGSGITKKAKNNQSHRRRRKRKRKHIPFHERIGCSVADAVVVSGESRSRLYEKMKAGKLAYWKSGKRRIVSVQSLLAQRD